MTDTNSTELLTRISEHNSKVAEALGQLQEASRTGQAHRSLEGLLDDLIMESQEHFAYEDEQLAGLGECDCRYHRNEHGQLLKKLSNFKAMLSRQRITKPFIKFLEYWLNNHVEGKDSQIKNCIMNKKEAGDGED
jgi:hemerythrin-like metal-binding protein